MEFTLSSSREDVQAALDDLKTIYVKQHGAIDAEARRQKKELQAWRIERRRALKGLLKVVGTSAQPSGKGEPGEGDE